MYVKVMNYKVIEYIVGWLFRLLQDGEKMADLSQNVFVKSIDESYEQTHE